MPDEIYSKELGELGMRAAKEGKPRRGTRGMRRWSNDMERYLKPGEPTDEEWAAALKREKLNA